MDLAEERDQPISHMEKTTEVWAGANEAVQLRKASSKQHQEHSDFSCLPCHTHRFLWAAG